MLACSQRSLLKVGVEVVHILLFRTNVSFWFYKNRNNNNNVHASKAWGERRYKSAHS